MNDDVLVSEVRLCLELIHCSGNPASHEAELTFAPHYTHRQECQWLCLGMLSQQYKVLD